MGFLASSTAILTTSRKIWDCGRILELFRSEYEATLYEIVIQEAGFYCELPLTSKQTHETMRSSLGDARKFLNVVVDLLQKNDMPNRKEKGCSS
jgi:hypothetical protein